MRIISCNNSLLPGQNKGKGGITLTRYRTTNGKEDLKQRMDPWAAMAIPLAFINGVYFGSYALRAIRQYWEGGPMD